MTFRAVCPQCSTTVPPDAPAGICPQCLLLAAIGPDDRTQAAPRSHRARRSLSADEIVERLGGFDEVELIGEGGMGAVYKARQTDLDRRVAIKVLDPELAETEGFAERFVREARTLARLTHPNIVTVYDFGNREGLYYLVMELVEGVTVRQTLQAGGLTPEEAMRMVPKICAALQYAHDQGVVHRDVKPENILLSHDGEIKIVDFGLAKLVGLHDSHLTVTRQVMGTPHYMAPEQIETPGVVDHRADIFALGVVLYEMLTGELPVGRFPPPSRKVEVDVRLDDVVLRTLEKEPRLRYQQVSELAGDVESLSSQASPDWLSWMGGATSGRRASSPWRRRRRAFEYRSKASVWGIPLVHIRFSRDPDGVEMNVARGIVAIGDAAVGAVAIGGFALGIVAIGGMSVGALSFAGLALGIIAAGGAALGLVSAGGVGAGLIGSVSRGAIAFESTPWLWLWIGLATVPVAASLLVGAWLLAQRTLRERAEQG